MAIKRLQPTLFIHFTDPDGADLFADPAKRLPIGVMAYGPGSKQYTAVQASITQANLDRKVKKVTAALIEQNAVALLAGVTFELVNFAGVEGYETAEASLETCATFYRDEGYANLREQVQEKLGDFSASATKP